MTQTIMVLTEEPLNAADVKNLQALEGDEETEFVVLVPVDREKSVVGEFLHHLSLLELAQAFRDLNRGEDSGSEPETSAASALDSSLAACAAGGLRARGYAVEHNAVEALVKAAAAEDAGQAVVVTRPHAVADTFHTDWANKAQDKLGIPVLHLYSGSGFIGGS